MHCLRTMKWNEPKKTVRSDDLLPSLHFSYDVRAELSLHSFMPHSKPPLFYISSLDSLIIEKIDFTPFRANLLSWSPATQLQDVWSHKSTLCSALLLWMCDWQRNLLCVCVCVCVCDCCPVPAKLFVPSPCYFTTWPGMSGSHQLHTGEGLKGILD